jgi:hypothetical protein
MEIKNFKNIGSNCLKAAFTLVIPEWGNIEIDCAYFRKDNGSSWFNYAAKEYTSKEGKKKFWNQVRWPQATTDKLSSALKEKIIEMMGTVVAPKDDEGELPF